MHYALKEEYRLFNKTATYAQACERLPIIRMKFKNSGIGEYEEFTTHSQPACIVISGMANPEANTTNIIPDGIKRANLVDFSIRLASFFDFSTHTIV